MPTEARVTSSWKLQRLLLAVALLAYAPFFFWDGAIGYPAADERYHEWKRIHDTGDMSPWIALAKQRDWKVDEWEKWMNDPHHQGKPLPVNAFGRPKYIEQYVCGSVLLAFGLIWLTYWLTQVRRTLRTDDEAVYSPTGRRIPFGAITGLGKKKWDAKGLATVLYTIEGRKGRFVLDDYKFDRDPTHQILTEIEAKLLARATP